MNKVILIGGFGQSRNMLTDLSHEVQKRLNSDVVCYTLAEFYKESKKLEILQSNGVITHSMGLWLIPENSNFSNLSAFNPPESAGLISSIRQVLFGEKFPAEHNLIMHSAEVILHPVLSVKAWLALRTFSASQKLADLKTSNHSADITLFYSSGDRIAKSSDHDLAILKNAGIKVKDIKGLHRSLHSSPAATLDRAGL